MNIYLKMLIFHSKKIVLKNVFVAIFKISIFALFLGMRNCAKLF